MRAEIARFGNSEGRRIPKAVREHTGLGEDVGLDFARGRLTATPAGRPRQGWPEAARSLSEAGEDPLLDPPSETDFDRDEWSW